MVVLPRNYVRAKKQINEFVTTVENAGKTRDVIHNFVPRDSFHAIRNTHACPKLSAAESIGLKT